MNHFLHEYNYVFILANIELDEFLKATVTQSSVRQCEISH